MENRERTSWEERERSEKAEIDSDFRAVNRKYDSWVLCYYAISLIFLLTLLHFGDKI